MRWTAWRAVPTPRGCRWISKKRSGGCPMEPGRCSCCTTSRGIATRRSPSCWGSCREHRNRSCITRAWRSAGISSAEGVILMNDRWTDRLSEYLDGELGAADSTALEAHLPTCADCRATLDQLRRVVARAQRRQDRSPTGDLWPAIARHVGV